MLFIFLATILFALGFAYTSYRVMLNQSQGNETMQELAHHIREGAKTFLYREYSILAIVMVIIALILWYLLGWMMAVAFVFGAATSAVAGWIGLVVATHGNVRACQAATSSLDHALRIAFHASAATGVTVVTLGLTAILAVLFGLASLEPLFGLSFGASLVALFARVGGGIFTKSADMAADLVGKVEEGIPEDDPRNPAVIADNVGDNVGDVAGMSADLFESYVGSIVSALTLGVMAYGAAGSIFPLLLAAWGLVASILATFTVRTRASVGVGGTLHIALAVANIIFLAGAFFLSTQLLNSLAGFWVSFLGVVAGTGIGLLTEYYTRKDGAPVRVIAESCQTSPATTILSGLSTGLISAVPPVLLLACVIALAHYTAGLWGIALAAVGMLATLGISLSVDAFGPTVDNAGGIAQMAGLPPTVRERTDTLDSVGNTTAAIGKGFAIGSAAITALIFFFLFTTKAQLTVIDLSQPHVLIGLLVGGTIPFAFCSMTMRAVGSSAFTMINEIRQQIRGDSGILAGKSKPNYNRCVDIATRSALIHMLLPGAVAVLSPILIRYLLGYDGLAGFLTGALTTGVLLAIALANSGGAWDNAKKLIETGKFGGTGSPAHAAAVIGDTVGDPLKDTSGPSLNILIKLMSIVSLLLT